MPDHVIAHRTPVLTALLLGVWGIAAGPTMAAEPPRPPTAARPNVLIILADDLGFADLGCYGSDIATPNLDRLAAGGLRFTQFYNTARCWPTRSALLTGYYPQQTGADPPQGPLPAWTRTLPQWLEPAGYRCYQSGKWHVPGAPDPRTHAGFAHSHVIEGGQNNYFKASDVVEDGVRLPDQPGFYMTIGTADHAIRCLEEHAARHPGQPFFQYLAFISPHFPLHALPEDITRYKDRYLAGWDRVREKRWRNLRRLGIVTCELAPLEPGFTPRYLNPDVLERLGPGEVEHPVPWSHLNDEQKEFQAAKMAIHAAMIDRMDREIGRVLDQVRAMSAWDDTIIMFLSDNGTDATLMVRGGGHDPAAAPGSANSYLCLGPGWSSAGNVPFRRHKIWTHEGGISTPFIVHWPQGIAARGELRHDVGHVVDIVPTLLDAAGIPPDRKAGAPAFPGRSLVPSFEEDGSVTCDYLFFHHEGNRGLRVGDYKLVSSREDDAAWELFDLATDRCEQRNLASSQPDRVREMSGRWQELQEEFVRDAGR
jgi:arylsulfatase A-like enzyme